MFNLESKTCFHLRITAPEVVCKEVMMEFHQKFKPKSSIVAFETSKQEVEHSHAHLEMSQSEYEYHISDKGKTARSAFFKKHNLVGKYNFQKLDSTALQNIQYCIKDDNIILELNVDSEQLQQIKNMVVAIQKNMKMDQRNKLLEAFIETHKHIPKIVKFTNSLDEIEDILNPEFPHKLYEIAEWIHWYYINIYDKPPPIIHMREYVLWIASKECKMDTKTYYFNMFGE